MSEKTEKINTMKAEFRLWLELLSGITAEEAAEPNRIGVMSIKDLLGHLTAWQQITAARLEAALEDRDPDFSEWPPEFSDPDTEELLDQINAWIYETHRSKTWDKSVAEWRIRFERLIKLAEAVPEEDLEKENKYPWIAGYPLSAVLVGTTNHHREHREEL